MINKLKKMDPKKLKIYLIITTAMLFTALVALISVNAWFTGKKSMETVTLIETPTQLVLGSGNRESIQRLDLGDIDAQPASESEIGVHRKQYVFSVSSPDDKVKSYIIQLAHTTNIPFKYKVYKAEELTSEINNEEADGKIIVPYTSISGDIVNYSFDRSSDSLVSLNIMNPEEEGSELLADQDDYSFSYDTYNNVQKNAKPVYLKSAEIENKENSSFIHYYILEIEWETGNTVDGYKLKNAVNNKETDIVYLMAITG